MGDQENSDGGWDRGCGLALAVELLIGGLTSGLGHLQSTTSFPEFKEISDNRTFFLQIGLMLEVNASKNWEYLEISCLLLHSCRYAKDYRFNEILSFSHRVCKKAAGICS